MLLFSKAPFFPYPIARIHYDLADDVICNIVIYAYDTTPY